MAIEILSAEEAWASLSKNKQNRWPSRQNPDRIDPIATPTTNATFKINPDEKIFCVGSCFAREIEQALDQLDYEVLSIIRDLPKSPNRSVSDAGMFNKYNVASIYNELLWALNPNEPYSHEFVFIENSNKLLQDYQLSGENYTDEAIYAKAFREKFNEAFKLIKESDVIILTLGLSEVWFDTQTKTYLNRAISRNLARLYPSRFQLHVFDYQQTSDFIEKIYNLLTTYLKPDFRLLITVSPIPLLYTFRKTDIFLANSYSKSVLRAAVESFTIGKDNVNYFPSYEFVTLSNPSLVWKDSDFRHVESSFINYIIDNVIQEFTAPKMLSNEHSHLLRAIIFYRGNFFKEAFFTLNKMRKEGSGIDLKLCLLWLGVIFHIQGKYKTLLLEAVAHLQKNKDNKLLKLLSYQKKAKKNINDKNYVGCLSVWNGKHISGWACCFSKTEPVKVSVIFENNQVIEALANKPRSDIATIYGNKYLNSGFSIMVNKKYATSNIIKVVFCDIQKNLTNSPMAKME